MSPLKNVIEVLSESDKDIEEIVNYIRLAFPTYEEALGAMGQRPAEAVKSADSSEVRIKVEPATTARVT